MSRIEGKLGEALSRVDGLLIDRLSDPTGAVAAVAEALTLNPASLRDARHCRFANAVLAALRDAGREWFQQDDMSRLYAILELSDQIAGAAPSKLPEAFIAGARHTDSAAHQAEAAAHRDSRLFRGAGSKKTTDSDASVAFNSD